MTNLKHCELCNEPFSWAQDVVEVGSNFYHKYCVTLYPIGYVAYTEDHDFIGETENGEGKMAVSYLSEGEYLDECECGSGELTDAECCSQCFLD